MNQTKKILLVPAAFIVCFFFSSCEKLETNAILYSSKPLALSIETPNLNPEVKRMLELASQVENFTAREYQINTGKNSLRFLPGSRIHLAWRLVATDAVSVRPLSVSYFTNEPEAIKAAEKARKQKQATLISPLDTLENLNVSMSPLLETFSSWSYEKTVEWVNRQIFENACKSAKNAKDLQGFPIFAAEQATIEFLRTQLPPDSPVLGRYIAEKRDERTFAALFPDFKSRIEALYAQVPVSDDVLKRRDFLASTWINDYQQNYSNRFITNVYVDFGKVMPTDVEIAAWENKYQNWSTWESQFRANGEKLAAMIPVVVQIK